MLKPTLSMLRILIIVLTLFAVQVATAQSTQNTSKYENLMGDPDMAEYPFKPGYGLMVSTLPDTTNLLMGIYAIDDRGYAEFPIIGKVKVSEMKRPQLIEFLKTQFRNYLRYPNIYVKPMVRVSLLGGFMRPGLYYVDIHNSLWQVVQRAGGTLRENGIYKMKWERRHDEQVDDLTPYFEKGVSLKEMGFNSGDQIWTPSPDRRTFWDTVGDVMPILTFATTIWAMYNTYQRDVVLLRGRY